MASFNYAEAVADALELIQEFGQKIPVARYSKTVDAVTMTESDNANLSGELDAVVLPASKGTVEAFDNRLVQALTEGRLRFMIIAAATVPFTPLPNDVVSFEGYHWHVLGSTPLNPAGTPIIYKVGVLRGVLSTEDAGALPLEAIEEAASSFNQIMENVEVLP